MDMAWYFTTLVLAFCGLALISRAVGYLSKWKRSQADEAAGQVEESRAGKTWPRLTSYLAAAPGDWYCFFKMSTLVEPSVKTKPVQMPGRKSSRPGGRPDKRSRAAAGRSFV